MMRTRPARSTAGRCVSCDSPLQRSHRGSPLRRGDTARVGRGAGVVPSLPVQCPRRAGTALVRTSRELRPRSRARESRSGANRCGRDACRPTRPGRSWRAGADAHVVAERHGLRIANREEAEHDPAHRSGRVRAVAAQGRPVLVCVDALVLHVGVDQIDEVLSVLAGNAYGVTQRHQHGMGPLVVLEAFAPRRASGAGVASRPRGRRSRHRGRRCSGSTRTPGEVARNPGGDSREATVKFS